MFVIYYSYLQAGYGLGPLQLDRWVTGFLKKFERVYELQKDGRAFSTPRRLLAALDVRFGQMLDETLEERMRRDGFGERLIQELASGMVRVNYGQGLDVGAFVGAVALCGSQGPLWAVEGGNQLLASKILESSGATLREATVRRIASAGTRYKLYADVKGSTEALVEDYDLVLLALPLRDAEDLQLSGFACENLAAELARPYQRIYATFYDTQPNPKALHCSEPVPGVILSTTGDGFNSIGLHNGTRKGDSKHIWKVFSPAPLTDEQSKRLFPSGPKCETFGWWAYPKYSKVDRQPKDTPFCLDGAGLYYCNAIEETASAMEMSVLGAKNCVLLASNRLKGTAHNIDAAAASSRL
ncbi:Pcyox1 [Symbiodinium pilosum]|uniref:Pcyox1 protein n=1 Tax=Symbiodinium pilosum TaxID=2952 RepID=A0A812NRY6_SYMPI|nr:Pcyox1 [Symbiodinium pilosum]